MTPNRLLHYSTISILSARKFSLIKSSKQIRIFIVEHGAVACIPDKANFRIKHAFDSELYKQRNIVERFFQRIKNYRHIATRYDKLAVCFENFLLLAVSVIHF